MHYLKSKIQNNEKIALSDFIDANKNKYPLLEKMIETEQDPEWHSEGNVFIHTQMVIDEVYHLFDQYSFSNSDKFILIMSAIFHDIGKFHTSKWSDLPTGRHLTARNHEYEGLSYLFYRFLEEDMTDYERNAILELVGYHQKPKLLIVKNKTDLWSFKLLTENIAGYLFYYFEVADMKGRICKDKETQLNYLEEFKMFCEEYDCFHTKSNINEELKNLFISNFNEKDEKALSFLIGKAKKQLNDNEIIDPITLYSKYFEQKNNHGVFYLMCGISGSGKTTTVEKIKSETTISAVIELDELRKQYKQKSNNRKEIDGKVRQDAKELIKRHLANKDNIIFDACNHRKDFRDILFSLAEEYFAKTVLVFVETPLNQCIKNDRDRSVRTLGSDIITKQRDVFQFPERYEANEIYFK